MLFLPPGLHRAGKEIMKEDLSHEETRRAIDLIMGRTKALSESGNEIEVLTVDNHADGIHILLELLKTDRARAEEVYKLLKMNGGNSSGNGIGCVNWNGEVYIDQFTRHIQVGSIRERPFSKIWSDPEHSILKKMRNKVPNLKGRCAECVWKDICGGNFRARAEAVTGDLWGVDPACYLTEGEISDLHSL